jgi:hypothetical protein
MFASVAFALLASAAATAPFHAGNGEIIPGEYIVMFHKTSTLAQRDAHMAKTEVRCLASVSRGKRTRFFLFAAHISCTGVVAWGAAGALRSGVSTFAFVCLAL